MLASVLLVGLLGMIQTVVSWTIEPTEEGQETHVWLAKVHKYIARRVLLIGFVTTSTGLAQF
jgi:hypothetical protein